MTLQYKPPKQVRRFVLTLVLSSDGVATTYDAAYEIVVVDEDGEQIRTPNTKGPAVQYMNPGEIQAARQLLNRLGGLAVAAFNTDPLP